MSVTEIELSESVANCLVKANILTLEQLAMTQEQDLMKHLKFESELRNEIVEKLHTLGLSLGMKFSDLLDQMDQEAEEAGKTPRSKAAFFQELAEQGHAPAQLWLGFRYREGDGVPQDYTKAVEWFRKAAEQGDATAQLFLGCCYRDGDGVPQDYLKAVEWFRKAAEQGDARAQFSLGFSYSEGDGVPQDYSKAVEWFRKAAEQGNPRAQFWLGCSYRDGEGVPQDYTKAVEWFRKAAEQGEAGAQFRLGCSYREGEGVPQDNTKAVEWFQKAAEQGLAEAEFWLGRSYRGGEGVSLDYSKAVEWFQKAAEQGNAGAQFWLGCSYRGGEGLPLDYSKAVEWFQKAAEQGNVGAQFLLGTIYRDGEGVPQDHLQAVEWFKKAAEQGDASAQFCLGIIYRDGEGVPQDYSQAVEWFKKAAEHGDATAQFFLGCSYQDGEGLPQDYEKAVEWFWKAAEQGDAHAKWALGIAYSNGMGVPQNQAKAVEWMRKAAAQGNQHAQEWLAEEDCGLSPGRVLLDRYSLRGFVGKGGMGVVWLAEDAKLEGRRVALKFLPDAMLHDPIAIKDLKRETLKSIDLTHHNIVRIYNFEEDTRNDTAFIVMEYVDGDNLHNLRADPDHEFFEVEELGGCVADLCDGLNYAHTSAGVIHRDLKPSNLLINRRGELKIADFGIARSIANSMSRLTQGTQEISGTLLYMSPQQLIGETPSVSDDIYSLGATLYDLLTGRPPFYTGSIVTQINSTVPPSIETRRAQLGHHNNAAIPSNWEKAIASCLEKKPSLRPRSVVELARMLGVWS